MSSSTPTAAGLNDQVVSLWLPQVLELLLIRPVPHLPLSLLGLVQVVQDRVLPRLEAVPVHEPALGAGGVVADQLDRAGHVEDVLPLGTAQTQKILE